jgi:EAL domain-containing protein (putative c-di-GMP-specific phosphodiesterase class I)
VRFAIDDFGMGYSSLNYLKRLPIQTIKIDRSFMNDLTRMEENASIVTAVIAMAKSLNLDTIAEGVETEEQTNFLNNCRCDKMQGFLFSHPLLQRKSKSYFCSRVCHPASRLPIGQKAITIKK